MGGFCISQLDGATYLRANDLTHAFALDLQRPGEWLVRTAFDGVLCEFNKMGCVAGAVVASGGTNFVNGVQVRAFDRYLTITGQYVQYKPLDLSGSWTTEATLSPTP